MRVRLGYLSRWQARERYGVEFSADGGVDKEETRRTRARLRDARTLLAVRPAAADAFEGPRRIVALPAAVRQRLGVGAGDLVELNTPAAGSALRAWVAAGDEPEPQLALGPVARAILAVREGDFVEVRTSAPREVQP